MLSDLAVEEFRQEVRPYKVKYLYKYRSVESLGLEAVFTDSKIYLPDPTKFNDPFDCKPFVELSPSMDERRRFLKELIEERNPGISKQKANKAVAAMIKRSNDAGYPDRQYSQYITRFGVCSLSEIPDNLLMWSHYADGHKGICLQFKADREESFFWEAFKVVYKKDRPVVRLMDTRDREQYLRSLLVKSEHWSYEQERRVIKEKKTSGGSGTYVFRPEVLSGVILGALISDKDEKQIARWVKSHPSRVTIYRASLDEKRFRLSIPGVN